MPSIGPWICDRCGSEIASEADGYVIAKTVPGDAVYHGFKIIHQGRCDDKSYGSSWALTDFVGIDGLSRLLAFLSIGPFMLAGAQTGSPPMIADIDEFTDFVRRVQVPGYERARCLFSDPDVQGRFSDASEYYPYMQEVLRAI